MECIGETIKKQVPQMAYKLAPKKNSLTKLGDLEKKWGR